MISSIQRSGPFGSSRPRTIRTLACRLSPMRPKAKVTIRRRENWALSVALFRLSFALSESSAARGIYICAEGSSTAGWVAVASHDVCRCQLKLQHSRNWNLLHKLHSLLQLPLQLPMSVPLFYGTVVLSDTHRRCSICSCCSSCLCSAPLSGNRKPSSFSARNHSASRLGSRQLHCLLLTNFGGSPTGLVSLFDIGFLSMICWQPLSQLNAAFNARKESDSDNVR